MRKILALLGFLGVLLMATGCKHERNKVDGEDSVDASGPMPVTVSPGDTVIFTNSTILPIHIYSKTPSICTQFPNGFNFTVWIKDVSCTITTTPPPPYTYEYVNYLLFKPTSCKNCQIRVVPTGTPKGTPEPAK